MRVDDKDKKLARKELLDAINWKAKKDLVPISPGGWRKVAAQIKNLHKLGYSYTDQLYAFKWWFEVKEPHGKYQGYGIVNYIIEEALLFRKRQSEFRKQEKQPNKFYPGGDIIKTGSIKQVSSKYTLI